MKDSILQRSYLTPYGRSDTPPFLIKLSEIFRYSSEEFDYYFAKSDYYAIIDLLAYNFSIHDDGSAEVSVKFKYRGYKIQPSDWEDEYDGEDELWELTQNDRKINTQWEKVVRSALKRMNTPSFTHDDLPKKVSHFDAKDTFIQEALLYSRTLFDQHIVRSLIQQQVLTEAINVWLEERISNYGLWGELIRPFTAMKDYSNKTRQEFEKALSVSDYMDYLKLGFGDNFKSNFDGVETTEAEIDSLLRFMKIYGDPEVYTKFLKRKHLTKLKKIDITSVDHNALEDQSHEDDDGSDEKLSYISPQSGSTFLQQFVYDEDEEVRLAVAKSEQATPEILLQLVDDEDEEVRLAVAKSEQATPEILLQLVDDEDEEVRLAVAKSEQATPEILLQLVDDEDEEVRLAVAKSEQVTPEMLLQLATNEDKVVIVLGLSRSTEDAARLKKHLNRKVRLAVAKSEKVTPEILLHLVNDEDEDVKLAIAKSEQVTPEILQQLALNQ